MKKFIICLILVLICSVSFAANGPTPLQSAVSSFWEGIAGTSVYTLDPVGIGTTTPHVTKALHVVGNSKFVGEANVTDNVKVGGTSVAANPYIGLWHTRLTGGTYLDNSVQVNRVSGDMIFTASGTPRLTFKAEGTPNLTSCPIYADNAAAGVGGLVGGDLYMTPTGVMMRKH